MKITLAWLEGCKAYIFGKTEEDNPYNPYEECESHHRWHNGFIYTMLHEYD